MAVAAASFSNPEIKNGDSDAAPPSGVRAFVWIATAMLTGAVVLAGEKSEEVAK